jgi:hypothetical protein
MIRREPVSASLDGEFVLFLIGMRINLLWKVHKWSEALGARLLDTNLIFLPPQYKQIRHRVV